MPKLQDTVSAVTDAVQSAPSLAVKSSAGSVGAGSLTTIVSSGVGWASYVGWSLTLTGALVGLISAYIGYLTMKEKRRENDINERKIILEEARFNASFDND